MLLPLGNKLISRTDFFKNWHLRPQGFHVTRMLGYCISNLMKFANEVLNDGRRILSQEDKAR